VFAVLVLELSIALAQLKVHAVATLLITGVCLLAHLKGFFDFARCSLLNTVASSRHPAVTDAVDTHKHWAV
jgi:hypothetical protein